MRLNPKQKPLRVSSQALPKPLLLRSEAVRSSPLRVSKVTNPMTALAPGQRSSPLSDPLLSVIPSVPGFPASPLSPATTYVVLPKENHMQLIDAATLDRKSGEAEGPAVRLNPKQKPLRVSSQALPKPLLLKSEAVRSSPLQVSVPTDAQSRGLLSRVNGEVREEQTVWARSANSLVGAFVWGSGTPQVPRLPRISCLELPRRSTACGSL